MVNLIKLILLAVVSVMLAGCNIESLSANASGDQTDNTNIGNDSGSDAKNAQLQRGQSFYEASCALCHGPTGTSGSGGSLIASLESGRARFKIEKDMPPAQTNLPACNAQCADDIATWLEDLHGLSNNTGDDNTDNGELTVQIESAADTYRRASILLGYGVPEASKLDNLTNASEATLKSELRSLMQGDNFRQFLKTGANDQLLVRSVNINDIRFRLRSYYKRFDEIESTTPNRSAWERDLINEIREEPLELINYVVQNDLPYTEILTADYTMMSDSLADLYRAQNIPADDQWARGKNQGQYQHTGRNRPSVDWDGANPISQPHVGILSSLAYLNQNPSTATNRNRARSRWTMYHFLGYDIEASAPRVNIDDASDGNNPTLNNPACTVCHTTMDPIAAAFQDYSDRGIFRKNRADNSLSDDYLRSDLFQNGQTWYADVLPAGFDGKSMPASEADPLRWLAEQITMDERFAEATIKFWWPAIFGNELYETPSLTELTEQQAFVNSISADFRASNYDFKKLLTELFVSDWFRATNISRLVTSEASPITYSGTRLLTPEEIGAKSRSLFNNTGEYLDKHYGAFGGIDSIDVTVRDRNINIVKMNVVKSNAYTESCSITYQDFMKPIGNRQLFNHIELEDVPGTILLQNTNNASANTVITQADFSLNSASHLIKFSRLRGDAQLTYLKLTGPNDRVIFDDHVNQLENSNTLTVASNTGRPSGYYRFNNASRFLTIEIPKSQIAAGDYRLEISHKATNTSTNSALRINMMQLESSALFTDASTNKARQQIQVLYERLLGEVHSTNSEEVTSALALFDNLRLNAQERGITATSGGAVQCPGESYVANFDPYFTFAAWKGLVLALSTDYSYITE
jgi:cytochrome c553